MGRERVCEAGHVRLLAFRLLAWGVRSDQQDAGDALLGRKDNRLEEWNPTVDVRGACGGRRFGEGFVPWRVGGGAWFGLGEGLGGSRILPGCDT